MRLFAAVLPPQGAIDELGALVDELRTLPGAGELRWTERSGWHYTLAFMGEVDEDLLPELSARMARAAHRTGRFRCASTGADGSAAVPCGPVRRAGWTTCGCSRSAPMRPPGTRASRWRSTAATRRT